MIKYSALLLVTFILCVFAQSRDHCGKVIAIDEAPGGLIFNGKISPEGQWPWAVALHIANLDGSRKYFCSGTLISDQHVLTAAHCIQEKTASTPISANNIFVNLGTSDISNAFNGEIRTVIEAKMHPMWVPIEGTNYDSDLAILKLSEKVDFTHLIQPACLPTSHHNVFEETGYVAGFGYSENDGLDGKLRYLKIPTVTQEKCLFHPSGFYRAASKRTFCGGDLDKSVCKGDSGSGFVIRTTSSAYVIIGIVSATILGRNENCRQGSYTIFTNIPVFVNWILTETGRRDEIKFEFWNRYDPSTNYVALNSIYVDEGGVRAYVARVIYDNKLIIGKFIRQHKSIYIAYFGEEIKLENNIEILATTKKHQWLPFTGEFPTNAVQGGYENSEKLFVGRRMHGENLIIGKIVESSKAIFIPHYSIEYRYDEDFEILVLI